MDDAPSQPGLPRRMGRYQVLGRLAAGGMGEILLGKLEGPARFERPVVLKRLLPHLAASRPHVEMFLDEARILARLRHPNIVMVHDLVDGEELFLVLEYLEGENLAGIGRRLATTGTRLKPQQAAYVVSQACAGLQAAHDATDAHGQPLGVVHRDVSPQNIFVTYTGEVKLLDFGVAKAANRDARTEAGDVKGKLEYMSPEHAGGRRAIDGRSDVFAMGIVLYELVTGRRLFKRSTQLATLKAIVQEPILPPSRLVSCPRELEEVCLSALKRSPDERPPTALAMRRELVRFLRSQHDVDELQERLAKLMTELFSERKAEKEELLRRVREGSSVVRIPAAEVDVDEAPPREEAETDTTHSSTVTEKTTLRRVPLSVFAFSAALLIVGAMALRAKVLAGMDVAQLRPRLAAFTPPGSALASSPTPADSIPPSPRPSVEEAAIELSISSVPKGAEVWIAGELRGVTPVILSVSRGPARLELELRKDGFEMLRESVVPDVNQRLRLVLRALPRRSAGHTAPPASAPDPLNDKWH